MPRALKVCSVTGCAELVPTGQSRCATHERQADKARGTARQRGYDHRHETHFRAAVLRRDPTCVIPDCDQPSTDADHHPLSRRELLEQGLNPNDPQHGRGLCSPHHKQETARLQPGGWNT